MSTFTLLILLVIGFAVLETPLFTVVAGLSMVCLFFIDFDPQAIQIVIIEMNRLASMPVLTALPLFTFVGCLLTETGAPRRIMNFMQAIIGWMPGGLAIAGLLACDFFTALTGASGVTVVAIGSVMYPILRQKDYDEQFTLGLIATSGSLGQLLPPSLPIILYGVVAQVEITRIFKAALLPSLLLVVVMAVYAALHQSLRRDADRPSARDARISWQQIQTTFLKGVWDWPIIVIIVIGVFGGFVTIAEVSAVVLVYVVVVEGFILKEVSFFRRVPHIIIESAVLSGAIIVILAVALGFTGYLVDEQIPNKILAYLNQLTENRYVFLAGLNVFLLIVGCIMDVFSAIIIVVPIMVPIALKYGIDPIHLCIIFMVNLEIGFSTPPVGINLFITSLKFHKPLTLIYRSSIPYLLLLLGVLMVITYVPAISLWMIQ